MEKQRLSRRCDHHSAGRTSERPGDERGCRRTHGGGSSTTGGFAPEQRLLGKGQRLRCNGDKPSKCEQDAGVNGLCNGLRAWKIYSFRVIGGRYSPQGITNVLTEEPRFVFWTNGCHPKYCTRNCFNTRHRGCDLFTLLVFGLLLMHERTVQSTDNVTTQGGETGRHGMSNSGRGSRPARQSARTRHKPVTPQPASSMGKASPHKVRNHRTAPHGV